MRVRNIRVLSFYLFVPFFCNYRNDGNDNNNNNNNNNKRRWSLWTEINKCGENFYNSLEIIQSQAHGGCHSALKELLNISNQGPLKVFY